MAKAARWPKLGGAFKPRGDRRLPRPALAAVSVVAALVVFEDRARAASTAETPPTSFPTFKKCSNSQEEYLEQAFRRAHRFAWRAHRLVSHIRNRPASERATLWNRDFLAGRIDSASPRRWFGRYDSDRTSFIGRALRKGAERFAGTASGLKRIAKIRCGAPAGLRLVKDEHTDGCPSANPGGSGPPSAYHAPVGTIVTCGTFWNLATNQLVDFDTRLSDSARSLFHEVMHYVEIDNQWVWDRRKCSSGGKSVKCYGPDRATFLAENNPGWARRNNANYEFFALAVGEHQRTFTGVWADKESAGSGGFGIDLSWDSLVEQWNQLAAQQYLADIETYVRRGERRYAALWRIGSGNGALHGAPFGPFRDTWHSLKGTQDLIDAEIYRSGGRWQFLGVYRQKESTAAGDGGLLIGISWEELLEARESVAAYAYLADLETYLEGGERKYVAVWRLGSGGDALIRTTSGEVFNDQKTDLDAAHQLIDYEEYLTLDGKLGRIGIWRPATRGRGLHRRLLADDFLALREQAKPSRTLVDVEEYSELPVRIP